MDHFDNIFECFLFQNIFASLLFKGLVTSYGVYFPELVKSLLLQFDSEK